jgi:hypothetical protein
MPVSERIPFYPLPVLSFASLSLRSSQESAAIAYIMEKASRPTDDHLFPKSVDQSKRAYSLLAVSP